MNEIDKQTKQKFDLAQDISELCTNSGYNEDVIYGAIRTNEIVRRPVIKIFDESMKPKRRIKTTPPKEITLRKCIGYAMITAGMCLIGIGAIIIIDSLL